MYLMRRDSQLNLARHIVHLWTTHGRDRSATQLSPNTADIDVIDGRK